MRRVLSLSILLSLVGGAQGVGATRLAQTCSEGVFLASAAVVAGSTIYDIASASASARRYNRAHLAIAPLVNPRNRSYGISASWSFGRSSHLATRAVAVPARRWPVRSVGAPATKSPSTAFVLSFASTAAPMLTGYAMGVGGTDAGWGVFLGGLVIGPSVGHFYVGEVGRGLATVALRGAGTVIGLYAIAPCFDDS
ncbi:MAG TPA: hypothetical protein VGU74_01800 [Gemmatimonadales bacterium]|nr:hypothetical protein [Gemmatimonadales bacterium]